MQEFNNLSFKSHTGLADIRINSFIPENCEIYMIIIHGMAEHSKRYNDFANYLKNNNVGVFTFDLPGHGQSISDESQLGYFGKNGYENIISDIKYIVNLIKSLIPINKKLILFGHSMGSIICRKYTALSDANVDGAIYCGTVGPKFGLSLGLELSKIVEKFKGDKYRTKLIHNIMHSGFLNEIENPNTKLDWLTRDDEHIKKYIDDPLSGFMFTANGFSTMFSWMKDIVNDNWAENVKQIPILIIAGDKDPVGANGKGPKITYERLKLKNPDVKLILYENGRHEILNEINNQEVYEDILKFIKNIE